MKNILLFVVAMGLSEANGMGDEITRSALAHSAITEIDIPDSITRLGDIGMYRPPLEAIRIGWPLLEDMARRAFEQDAFEIHIPEGVLGHNIVNHNDVNNNNIVNYDINNNNIVIYDINNRNNNNRNYNDRNIAR